MTATVREIRTHTMAILLDIFSSRSLRIAMKRSSTWGIPKYPSPHASMEKIFSQP